MNTGGSLVGKKHLLRGLDISLLPIFHDVPADLLERITPEMLRFYGDGAIILAEGAPADNLLILLRGQVRVILNGTFLVTRFPYAAHGEQAFINKTVRSTILVRHSDGLRAGLHQQVPLFCSSIIGSPSMLVWYFELYPTMKYR